MAQAIGIEPEYLSLYCYVCVCRDTTEYSSATISEFLKLGICEM